MAEPNEQVDIDGETLRDWYEAELARARSRYTVAELTVASLKKETRRLREALTAAEENKTNAWGDPNEATNTERET